ncbi:alcohol dehydrogenase transcription factor myb/SANT-like domain-containing protein [Phthorimaea operculella]|nr:alcohol dehydrogenase transcription factor myb/SANT-like domain-containing protein [Phthorimaea operculella]
MSKCLTERVIITELLQLYKDFPCLWDNREILYTNREIRQQAYDVLLEKYRQLYENATLKELKKRLENFRSCFRREHKRVLLSRQNGEDFTPTLWYYHMLTFLIDVMDWSNLSLIPDNVDLSFKSEFIDEESSSSFKRLKEPQYAEKPSKMRRLSSVYTQDEPQFYEDSHEIVEELYDADCGVGCQEQSPSHRPSTWHAAGTAPAGGPATAATPPTGCDAAATCHTVRSLLGEHEPPGAQTSRVATTQTSTSRPSLPPGSYPQNNACDAVVSRCTEHTPGRLSAPLSCAVHITGMNLITPSFSDRLVAVPAMSRHARHLPYPTRRVTRWSHDRVYGIYSGWSECFRRRRDKQSEFYFLEEFWPSITLDLPDWKCPANISVKLTCNRELQ